LNPATNPFSVSIWALKHNPCPTGDDDHLFGAGITGVSTRMYFRCKADVWNLRTAGSPDANGPNVTLDRWYFVTFVMNGTTAILYLDGVPAITQSYASYTVAGEFYLGSLNGTGYTTGRWEV
jgi:hypothetical protein